MGQDGPGAQQAQTVGMGHGAQAVLLQAQGRFLPGLGQMDVQRQAQLVGQLPAGRELRRRGGIDAVGHDGHMQAVMPGPALRHLPCAGQGRIGMGAAGRGKVEHALAGQAAQTCPVRRFQHGGFEDVHVHAGRGAGAQHLGKAQQAAQAHQVGRQALFHGKDLLLQPVHERHVVGQAPQEGHGRVGMGVDKAGHDEHAGKVEDFTCLPCGRHIPAAAQGDDAPAVDGQGGVFKDAPVIVLGQQDTGMEKRVAGLHGCS